MEYTLPGMELQIPEFSIIDIKYDGPSFEGVMDISSLGNELLGLEYCLREIFKKIRSSNKIYSEILDSEFIILVEPFQNNCFRKKIKLATIRREINKLTGKEISVFIGVGAILTSLVPQMASGVYTLVKDFTEPEIQQVISQCISPELILKIGDPIKIELLCDGKFRREIATIATPLIDPNDNSEIRTKNLEGKEQIVTIDSNIKNKFLAIAGIERTTKVDELYLEKSEILHGRINAIDVDAPKRQLGFKVNGEGKEVDCTLSGDLNVNDYIKLVGKWVSIEGIITYRGVNPEKIEVTKIIESEPSLREYTTAKINF